GLHDRDGRVDGHQVVVVVVADLQGQRIDATGCSGVVHGSHVGDLEVLGQGRRRTNGQVGDRADRAELVVVDSHVGQIDVTGIGDLEAVCHGVAHVGRRRPGLHDRDGRVDGHQVVVVVVADLQGQRVDTARRDDVVNGRAGRDREVLGERLRVLCAQQWDGRPDRAQLVVVQGNVVEGRVTRVGDLERV